MLMKKTQTLLICKMLATGLHPAARALKNINYYKLLVGLLLCYFWNKRSWDHLNTAFYDVKPVEMTPPWVGYRSFVGERCLGRDARAIEHTVRRLHEDRYAWRSPIRSIDMGVS